ncbi:MAG: phosphatidate cytidylyltransferase, partial [Bacteroidales bacterium]|nr:phosphatidate cytidylyltransferase [Bacteroidales bacterium]
ISMLFHAKELIEADKGTHLFFPIIYIGIPMALLPMLMFPSGGKYSFWYFIMLIVLIWLSDTGAYIFGMAFGQRPGSKKFCPVISPKKSWIGVVGGVVVTIATAILLKYLNITPLSLLHMLVIALLVCIFGISGDLFESLIKRHSGCKDSGNIMPGHGGLLDRFDSALFVIPVIVVYLQFNGLLV